MFSERDIWVQSIRRQELEEDAQKYRFAMQINGADLASKSVFQVLLNLVGQILVRLGIWLQSHYSDSNSLTPPAQRLSGQTR
jgi:hypothetical protein